MVTNNETEPVKLSDRVYAELAQAIKSGEYGENLRLPSEMEMSKRYRVSRPILRQALSQLRMEGLVSARKGSGWYVQRRSSSGPVDFGQLNSVGDIKKCLEFRRGIEGEAAWHAAKERTGAQISEIERTIRAMRNAISTGSEGIKEDFDFHLSIAQASGNRYFVVSLESLRTHINFGVELIRKLSTESMAIRINVIEGEHTHILEAIRERNPDAARQAMISHIGKGISRIFSSP